MLEEEFQEEARKERGRKQPIYLASFPEEEELKSESSSESSRHFKVKVLGTTKTIYNVKLNFYQNDKNREEWEDVCTCSCPDFTNRQQECKHIFFIMYRVLRGSDFDTSKQVLDRLILFMKVGYGGSETDKNNLLSPDLLNTPTKKIEIRKWEGEECAICCDEMEPGSKIWSCSACCGKSLHANCFVKWKQKTCPYCRHVYES